MVLKRHSPLLIPDLPHALTKIGHCVETVLADVNVPAATLDALLNDGVACA